MQFFYFFPTGTTAISAAHSLFEGAIGIPISLEVFVFGIPEIQPDEISWTNPSGQIIRATSGIAFLDGGTRLLLEALVLSDNGTYHVQINREGMSVSDTLDLLIHSKLNNSTIDNNDSTNNKNNNNSNDNTILLYEICDSHRINCFIAGHIVRPKCLSLKWAKRAIRDISWPLVSCMYII